MVMNKNDIKNKLLDTGCFIENQYLDLYCELITQNLNRKCEKYRTQKHHILPKNYFRWSKQPIDNSKDNLVNLLYTEHLLAHKYLAACTNQPDIIYANYDTFNGWRNDYRYSMGLNEEELSHIQCIYEQYKRINAQRMKQMHQEGKFQWMYNNEEWKQKIRKAHLGKKHSEETKQKISIHNKNPSIVTRQKIAQANGLPVQNLNTGEVFNSATEAELKYNPNKKVTGNIQRVLHKQGKHQKAFKCYWIQLPNSYEALDAEMCKKTIELFEQDNSEFIDKKSKKIYCIETKEIFKSGADVEQRYSGHRTGNMSQALKQDIPIAYNLHWKYLNDKRPDSYFLQKVIRKVKYHCIELNQDFDSVKDILLYVGKTDNTPIYKYFKGIQKQAWGYHWIKIEE